MMFRACFVLVSLFCPHCAAWYLPGVAPHDYSNGDVLELHVNKLTSIKTQVPFGYYHLPFCRPPDHSKQARGHSLGEVLSGDDVHFSPYVIRFRQPAQCAVLCTKHYDEDSVARFVRMIDDEYRVHWQLDNLPVAVDEFDEHDLEIKHVSRGFPVGFTDEREGGDEQHFVYNHARITISYNVEDSKIGTDSGTHTKHAAARVVGFHVEPFSVHHKFDESNERLVTCNQPMRHDPSRYQRIDLPTEVTFTYDVNFVESDVRWANRWDIFLSSTSDEHVHWFAILNSFMVVLFLSSVLALIMVRTLHKDIAQYNAVHVADAFDFDAEGGAEQESGWKLIYGDVFRPPAVAPAMLAVFIGTGVQVTVMTLSTLFFALSGLLSPANRGALVTAFLVLFVVCGVFAGYFSARFYKLFGGKSWKRHIVLTATFFPGCIFSVFFILNLFLWHANSSGAVPFVALLVVVILWVCISIPLTFFGAHVGLKQRAITIPMRVSQVPRPVPQQPWFMQWWLTVLAGGLLPFGAIFVELFHIMSSIWLHQIYYLYGFLIIVFFILAITCAEVAIVLCYAQLNFEDHNWWWRSFLGSGSSSLYLMVYSVAYFFHKLEISSFVSVLLYFGYMSVFSFAFMFLAGTFGFFATFAFVRKIYGSIKVE